MIDTDSGFRLPEGVIVVKDIVERLWICPHFITGDQFGYPVTMPNEMTKRNQEERIEAAREISKLRKMIREVSAERDEARREVCNLMYQRGFPTGDYAKGRGWDCFQQEDGK